MAMEALAAQAGIRLVHVPYGGGPAELKDIVGGQVPIGFIGIAPALPFLKGGQVKALAVTGQELYPQLPSIPTVAETLPGYSIDGSWLGLFAPARTPDAIVGKLSDDINGLFKEKDILDFLADQGIVPMGLGPAETRRLPCRRSCGVRFPYRTLSSRRPLRRSRLLHWSCRRACR